MPSIQPAAAVSFRSRAARRVLTARGVSKSSSRAVENSATRSRSAPIGAFPPTGSPPSGVDVQLLSEVPHGVGGALEGPPRPAGTEGRAPGRLVRLGRPPEDEVQGIPLGAGSDRAEQPLVAQLAQHRQSAPP